MVIVYNPDGTIDLMATREESLGNPSPNEYNDSEEFDEAQELQDFFGTLPEEEIEIQEVEEAPDTLKDPDKVDPEEFWADSCWAELPGKFG